MEQWLKNNMMYRDEFSNGWCVSPTGGNVMVGKVDSAGNLLVENPPEVVSKLENDITITPDNIQAVKDDSYETPKHPGGRPRKEENISRVTRWRREREKQLSML